jgi:hypothetical protein
MSKSTTLDFQWPQSRTPNTVRTLKNPPIPPKRPQKKP